MKIAILHHDIEMPELKFSEYLIERDCVVDLYDIRETSYEQLLDYNIVFNRVYSSVASRDFEMLYKTLSILNLLEKRGVKCINSFSASFTDYDKYRLYQMLSKKGIRTPQSIFIKSSKEINRLGKKAIKELGFPLVIKRNCGGKSYDVTRVNSFEEIKFVLNEMFKRAEEQGYKAGFLFQKFVKSIRDHDCRIGIVNGKFSFAYARSLITRNSTDNWMASTSGGSKEFFYNPTSEEVELAIKANKAIGALFSESDVMMTEEGPYIIEVNSTPGYFIEDENDIERMKIAVDSIIRENAIENLIEVEIKG